jgi:hypothetical protein
MRSASLFRLTLMVALALWSHPAGAKSRRQPAESSASPAPAVQQPALPPPDDTAKFLAGMPLRSGSPLAPLTQEPAWQEHSEFFEKAFAKLNTRQLNKVHALQDEFLPETKAPVPVAYYMFSGPDLLYVDQFFPNASVYILCGKESMGPPPDPFRITNLYAALHNLESAMHSSLTTSYFITQEMKVDLQQQNLNGTLPILYVFLARSDKTIRDVTYISLTHGGAVQVSRPGSGGTPGVRINYRDNHSGRAQTMYYFTTDISDGGISSNPAFMNFCNQFGVGASFLKSSSYLMFEDGFSRVRNFILDHSNIIVQDDSGIPIANFNRDKWSLRLFGTYVGPIELFQQHYQPRLKELFEQNSPPALHIGFGYQWNFHKANLIVAQRK